MNACSFLCSPRSSKRSCASWNEAVSGSSVGLGPISSGALFFPEQDQVVHFSGGDVNKATRSIAAAIVALAAVLAACPSVAQQRQSEDTEKALRAQADRAGVIYQRGKAAHYTQKFDLSGMPHYVPKQQLTGWVRLHGNNYLSDGMLGEYWQQGFAKFQPGIRLSFYLPTSALAFAALYYDQADMVMGHRPGFYDLLAYERVKSFDPLEITAVPGPYDVGGGENSLTFLVTKH